jgi:hypothetical protein
MMRTLTTVLLRPFFRRCRSWRILGHLRISSLSNAISTQRLQRTLLQRLLRRQQQHQH